MNYLILVRGLPASGKSTFSEELVERGKVDVHIEADMYHLDQNCDYTFNPSNARAAHEWCQDTARCFLREGKSVVVSNTFTEKWELEPYIEMLPEGFTLHILKCTGEYDGVHNVPEDVLKAMADRFEDIEGEKLIC